MVKVGVLLARQPGDLGEWLADGAAFDAAGAGALWLDLLPSPELDPLALAAALAAVTHRSLLVTSIGPTDGSTVDRARLLGTVERLSRGRLRVIAEGGALADADSRAGHYRRIPGDPEVFDGGPDGAQRWVTTPLPDSRAAWRATLLDAAEQRLHGLVVPADPRLLDLLRNPDDLGDRRDLQLAQG